LGVTRSEFILGGGVKLGLPIGLGAAAIATLSHYEQALENPFKSGFLLVWGVGLALGFLGGCLIASVFWKQQHRDLP
jgi:type III secretory pathway component EscT